MHGISRQFISFIMVTLMIISGMMVIIGLMAGETDTGVEAAMSEKDDFGYMYVDSIDPAPRIEFDWIDCTQGTETSLDGDDTVITVDIPFSFPFYGNTYTKCYPSSNGLLGIHQSSSTLSNYPIPTSGSVNGFIAPYWDDTSVYKSRGARLYTLEGSDQYGTRFFAIEWYRSNVPYYNSGPSYEITYEVLLFEDGMIKIQYLDATSSTNGNGASATCGIESPTGNDGVQYSNNQAILKDGLAVMFGSSIAEIKSVEVDVDEGGTVYAESREYSLVAEINHPINNDMIKEVSVSIGNGLGKLMCNINSGNPSFTEVDPNNFLRLFPSSCNIEEVGENILVTFAFTPTFEFPIRTYQDLVVGTGGLGVMPGTFVKENTFWVESQLELVGSLYAYSNNIGYIDNGGWVSGGEEFKFSGLKAVYPGTSVTPMTGAITMTLRDEVGNRWIQKDVENGELSIDIEAESDHVKKTYIFNITDIPEGTDISDPVQFKLSIDPFRPSAPKEVLIHADSFDDRNTEFDDDNEVFISWEPSEDFESGVKGYYISIVDPYDTSVDKPEPKFIKSPDTSTILVFEEMGTRKIWVWAIDRAGNPSIPGTSLTKIDATEVSFSEFSPGHQVWVNTKAPVCSVLIDDSEGSGVSAQDLQFSTSTTNTLEFGAWQSSDIRRDGEQIRLSMKALFTNGKNNWVRFRAKDVAGNGWTYSQNYNVWVDEERPSFVNFRPFEVEYQNGKTVVVSVDISDSHSSREGSGIRLDTVEYRVSTQGKGLFGSWMEAPISSVSSTGVVHVEMELDFAEGVDNYIQFRCYDNVGNYANSKEYNILVNAAPDVSMFISEPENEYVHTSAEKILFDASGTRDPDGDDLTFTWYSDINGFLSSSDSFFRTLSPGVHVITLVVNDPAHSIVRTIDLEVLEETQINPEDIDTDGDGIYDAWEEKYLLDPYRPDSFLDSDSDLFTNFQEFQNGTDPTRSVSHPPYREFDDVKDPTEVDDTNEQYMVITLALGLVVLLVIIVLISLIFSKRHSFALEREEEKELELEEIDYRKALEKKKDL